MSSQDIPISISSEYVKAEINRLAARASSLCGQAGGQNTVIWTANCSRSGSSLDSVLLDVACANQTWFSVEFGLICERLTEACGKLKINVHYSPGVNSKIVLISFRRFS